MAQRPAPPAAPLLLLAVVLMVAPPAAAQTRCHIHPPAEDGAEEGVGPTAIIGPYPSADTCEQARRERFGALGRCHCRAAFTPGWLDAERRPGQATDQPRSPAAVLP